MSNIFCNYILFIIGTIQNTKKMQTKKINKT